MHFSKFFPYRCDEEINSGKQNVLTRIQYYDTLNTLPQHSWRMSLWSEWELELQRLITIVKCMHFLYYGKKHCSIFVNIFYNKRCNYWLCGIYLFYHWGELKMNLDVETDDSICLFLFFLTMLCNLTSAALGSRWSFKNRLHVNFEKLI